MSETEHGDESVPRYESAFKGFHVRTQQHSPTDVKRVEIAQELRLAIDELLATSAPLEELEETRKIINQAVSRLQSRPHSHEYVGPAEGSLAPMNHALQICRHNSKISSKLTLDYLKSNRGLTRLDVS